MVPNLNLAIQRCLLGGIGLTLAINALASPVDSSDSFIVNHGQWDPEARFLAQSKGLNLWLTSEGAVMDFHQTLAGSTKAKRIVDGQVIRMSFVNSGTGTLKGLNELKGTYNYFRGGDSSSWTSNVKRYSEACADNVYNGVQARYYFSEGFPRYDLIIQPGADPSQIAMRYEGANGMRVLANGNLQMVTSLGVIEEQGLVAYQSTSSGNKQIACKMRTDGETVRFSLGSYDQTKTLVIDPLIFSTFLGGSSDNLLDDTIGDNSLAIDSSGNEIVVGSTDSADYPHTTGAYQTTHEATTDACISKLSPDGKTLLYSTFLGESCYADCVALDSSDNAYVMGRAFSANFPTTVGAFQRTLVGDPNAYVTKLSADGTSLVYSTFLGGGGGDTPTGIAVDAAGEAVGVGTGEDNGWPVTVGAFQTKDNPDLYDGLIFKLSADGSKLIFCSYLGGIAFSAGDFPYSVAIDSSNNVVIAGTTWSADFPVTKGSYDTNTNNQQVAFVVKLNPTGTTEIFGTFLAGPGASTAASVALDPAQNVVLVGFTGDSKFPLTPGAYQTAMGPSGDIFVAKLSPTGSSLLASTLIGGLYADTAYSLAVDKSGNIVIAGTCQSYDYPVTPDAYQSALPGAEGAFLSKFSPDCKSLLYSTFFGGEYGQAAQCVALDSSGNAVIKGYTSSPNMPTSTGAFQTTLKGNTSLFVAKFGIGSTTAESITLTLSPGTVTGGVLSYGTVTLSPVAPAGGASVSITSGANALGTLPFTAGAATEQFSLTTGPVDAIEVVPITVSYNGASQTQNLTIVPPVPATLVLSSSSVVGGTGVTGTLTLTGGAGPSGVPVALSSSNTAAATVAATTALASGVKTTTFAIATKAVSSNTGATITASFGGVSRTAALTVLAAGVTLASVKLNVASIAGGTKVGGAAYLTADAGASPIVITLKSSNTAVATLPASITVAAHAPGQYLTVTTLAVTAQAVVIITATTGTVSKTVTLTVTPSMSSLHLNVSTIVGGTKVGGAAYLSGHAGTLPVVIYLKSSNPAVATLPASVTAPVGGLGQYLTVTTLKVTVATVVTITATTGSVSRSATVTIEPSG